MHVFKTADLQCIWLPWIICVRQLYGKLHVSAGTRLSACVIPLHTTIWLESEALRYLTVGPARCQGVLVPRWLGHLAKTFACLDLRRQTLQLKQYFPLMLRFSFFFLLFLTHLDMTRWAGDLWNYQAVYVCTNVAFLSHQCVRVWVPLYIQH